VKLAVGLTCVVAVMTPLGMRGRGTGTYAAARGATSKKIIEESFIFAAQKCSVLNGNSMSCSETQMDSYLRLGTWQVCHSSIFSLFGSALFGTEFVGKPFAVGLRT